MTTKSFDAFLTRVTEQMKSKEGKHLVQKELHSHLLQSKKANMRAGYSEGEAEVNAISRMGDPVQLGKKMNKLHRPLIDWWMLALVGGLFLLSFVPFLLVDIQAMRVELQLLSVFISFIFMFSLMLMDFRKILTKWKWFLGAAIFYIIFFCLGTITELPYMYYSFGLLKFEIFGVRIPHQWFLMLIFIGLVGYISNVQINSYKQLIPLFIIMWFPILLIGKHLGPFLSILLVMITLTVVAFSSLTKKLKKQFLTWNGVIIWASLLWAIISLEPHRYSRIAVWLKVDSDPGESYVPNLLRDIIQSSTLWGQTDMTWVNAMPDIHTVTALTIVIYYGGWLLTAFLITVFIGIIVRLVFLLVQMQHQQARLMIAGGMVLLTFPFVYNTLMIFGLLPYSAVNFPILSYGGAERIYYSAVIGLMLSVYRQKLFLRKQLVNVK